MPKDDRSGRKEARERTDGVELQARIDAARAKLDGGQDEHLAGKYNTLTLAWRMTIELVVGAAIGFGMGWGLDQLFGTAPLMMIVFGLLGFVAGIKVVIATAKEAERRSGGDGSA